MQNAKYASEYLFRMLIRILNLKLHVYTFVAIFLSYGR